jgi:fibronectin-binding autotransporter adhesin
MPGLTAVSRVLGRREVAIGAAAAALAAALALTVFSPAAAHGTSCQDSWTNAAGGSWFEGADWTTKAPPSAGEEACITLSGTYTVTLTTGSTVTVKSLTLGGESGTQTLSLGNTTNATATLDATAAIGVGAHGALTLTDGPGANGQTVTLESPSIADSGAITSEPDQGGARDLKGSLTNKGTLAINANTSFNASKAVLTNEGTVSVANEKALTVSSEGSFLNGSGGKIAASGSGNVSLESGTAFTEGAGTTSGTLPVIINGGSLDYTGAGASTIAQRGTGGTLSGASSAGQSLLIENVTNQTASVTAGAGFANGGAITLTDAPGANGQSVTLDVSAGTLTNTGAITTEEAAGGGRFLQGNLANKGTLTIDTNTSYNASKALLTNEGALTVATGKALTVSAEGSVTNGSGGTIAGGSSGEVFLESGTSFTEGAGTTSGTLPVIIQSGSLDYTGAGASTIAQRGEGGSLRGASSSGQTLLIENNTNQTASVTATGFTNGGAIALTDAPSTNGQTVTLASSGTLTNTGSITTEADLGGTRVLQGAFLNKGTLAIDAPTNFNGASGSLTNEGSLNVGEGFQLVVSNAGSVTNAAGNIAGGSGEHPGDVLLESGTSFTQGNGTTSGTLPVIIQSGSLDYTGTGTSTIAQRGSGGSLAGNLAAKQTLLIENNTNQTASVAAAASFTNAGAITLTDAPGANGQTVTLEIAAGTLTNTGTITSEPDLGGARQLKGDVTNRGTLAINANTSYNASKAVLTNEGAVNVANEKALTVSGEGAFVNGAGGKIAATGSGEVFLEPDSAFTEGAGTTTGTLPVVIDSGSLTYTGAGASTLAERGTSTLTGAPVAKQTLSIQNNTNQTATVTAAASLTNGGTIILTDAPASNGQSVSLLVAGGTGTLTNKGTITAEHDQGGTRTIEGTVKNEKTLSLTAGVDLKVTGAYTQGKSATLKPAVAGAGDIGELSVTGAASIAGTLALSQSKTFHAKAGETFAVLSSSALTGTFAKETGDAVAKAPGLYYKPVYSGAGVTLVVTQATVTLSASSGAPGSTVTVSGTGLLPGDTVKLTFTDHKKVKTTSPSATVNGSGEFSSEVTIPAGAAEGAGSIAVKSTDTGVSITKTFTVT